MKRFLMIMVLSLVWGNTVSSSNNKYLKSEGFTDTSKCNFDYLIEVIELFKDLVPKFKLAVNKKCKIYLVNYEEFKKKKSRSRK